MFQDILRDTEIYQYIMQEGLAEGIQQGVQQGVQQELQDLRLTIIRMVQARFPKLASFAIEQTASIEDPLRLQDLIVDISAAQTADQVRQLLAEVDNKNNK